MLPPQDFVFANPCLAKAHSTAQNRGFVTSYLFSNLVSLVCCEMSSAIVSCFAEMMVMVLDSSEEETPSWVNGVNPLENNRGNNFKSPKGIERVLKKVEETAIKRCHPLVLLPFFRNLIQIFKVA